MTPINLSSEIILNKSLTILGNGPTKTIIDGMGTSRIFHVPSGVRVSISGSKMQGGNGASPFQPVVGFTSGGAIYNLGNLTLTNSLVSGNTTSEEGGGISSYGTMTVTNSEVSGNSASFDGGGIYNNRDLKLTNSEVSGNTANDGGGIYNDSDLTMTNSIIAKNAATSSGPDIHNDVILGTISGTYNLIGDGAGQTAIVHGMDGNQVGTSAMPIDPLFVMDVPTAPSTGGDLRLQCGSPAIDAGDDTATNTTTDINGLPRKVGTIDIGAHERPADMGSKLVTTLADDGLGSLRDMVRIACSGDTIRFDASLDMDTIKLITEIVIDTNLVILGNDTTNTIIDGMGTSRIFYIPAGDTVAIDGIRMQGGNGVGATLSGEGGAFYNAGVLTVTNSMVSGNTGRSGGGIANPGSLTVTNSVVNGNTADFGGGGIASDGALTFTNSVVNGNIATDDGGGIYNDLRTVTLTNSIITNNGASSGLDIFNNDILTDGGHNLIGDGSGQTAIVDGMNGNQVGTTAMPIDPLFVMDVPAAPSTGGDLRLQCGSPAIDAGDNTANNTTTDINGHPRIVTKTIDIGAYELQAADAPGPVTLVTNTKDSGCGSLRFAICHAMPGDTIRFDASLDMDTIKLITEIVIDTNLIILGNDTTNTIIDGMGTSRIFYIPAGDTVSMSGIKIQGGRVASEPFLKFAAPRTVVGFSIKEP